MVQRKAPGKPIPSIQQYSRTKAGADLKKTMKTSFIPERNYMKPTSSSEARKGIPKVTVISPVCNEKKNSNSSSLDPSSHKTVKELTRQSSLKPARSSMKKSSAVNRATCSSTLKNSKFSSSSELKYGASKLRVCPYTYCSLNGHVNDEPLPPLKCFISAGRKLLETQRDVKRKDLYSFQNSKIDKEREEKDHDTDQGSEFSQDEMNGVMMDFLEYVEFDHEIAAFIKGSEEEDAQIKLPKIQTLNMDWEERLALFPEEQLSQTIANSYAPSEEEEEEDDPEIQNPPNGFATDNSQNEGISSSGWNFLKRGAPNFLSIEPYDPGQMEKVDLRHQMLDARRNAEEWMIDYALQLAVMKLSPVRKRNVALLVEAFETVIPTAKCERPLINGTTALNQLSFQACN